MSKSDSENGADPLERISRQDLHLETMSRLAQLVAASEPGTRLPTERQLAERLGVGRSTLREAMRLLAFIGATTARQGSGTYISTVENGAADRLIGLALTVQRSRVHEVIEARRVLETEIVRLAAARYEPADQEALEEVMQRMRDAVADPQSASRHDLQYHMLLARASHNSVLVHFSNGMRGLLDIWMKRAVNREPVVQEIVEEHQSILDAVLNHDPDLAASAMANHLNHAAERLFSVVGQDHSMANYISLLFSRGD